MLDSYEVVTRQGLKVIKPSDGHVLPHEHVLHDMRVWWEGTGAYDGLDSLGSSIRLENLDELRRHPHGTLRENLVLSDWYEAAKELVYAKESGCQLLVDLSTVGLDPQPALTTKAAKLAGIHVVGSVGRYLDAALSDEEREVGRDDLVRNWLEIAEDGADGYPIGMIGEIGTSASITPAEYRSLEAAARVQAQKNLPINVHLHPFARNGTKVLTALDNSGAHMDRVILSHCDADLDLGLLKSLLERGCYVEFDLFGTGPWFQLLGRSLPSDMERVRALGNLAEAGYLERLLVSHDVCMKSQLRSYGGSGYAYLGTVIFDMLDSCLGQDARRHITVFNPLTVLSVA